MRCIRVLPNRASDVVKVLENNFEAWVLYWLRGRFQPANDNIEGRHLIEAGVYGRRSPSDAERDRPHHPCGATDRQVREDRPSVAPGSRTCFIKLCCMVALAGLVFWKGFGVDPAQAAQNFDGRVMVDAMEYPWSALGRLNAGGKNFCTGALVSDRHVLTKAHCLYNSTEGRWWHPMELHFLASYQRENYRIHSAIARYQIAPGYGTGETLADLINDWAVLTLEQPIGRQAGWIALHWLDKSTLAHLERGKAYILAAGYRPGQDHAITVTLDCGIDSLLRRELVERGACRTLLVGAAKLSKLLFINGEFRVLAPQQMSRAFARSVLNGQALSAAHAPGASGPVSQLPRDTIHTLLQRLGYATGINGSAESAGTRAAIIAFEEDRGLPVTGEPSMTLLGQLIAMAN